MARELGGSSYGKTLFWGHGNGGFSFGDQCTEAANKRIKETPKENREEVVLADTLLKLRPFGLTLNVSPSLIDSMAKNLNPYNHQPTVDDFGSQPMSEKLKASNFSASLLKIGIWERRSRNEGDLVAKCYYAKKKLVWEFLEKGLKNKIEIQWNDIIAMKAHIQEDEPGILEIELGQPPTFHEETDPQPRKHTIWRITSDFTGGHASIFRRHYLVFPPGSLDKHYEKLLQCDSRLYGLSRGPFPSLESPYFERSIYDYANFSFNYHRERQFNFGGMAPPLMAVHYGQYEQAQAPPQLCFKETRSPVSVMDFSHSDEQISNNVFENPRMAIWAQGLNNNAVDSLAAATPFNQVNAAAGVNAAAAAARVNAEAAGAAISYHYDNHPSAFNQGGGSSLVNNMLLSNLADHLLSDSQVEVYDEKYHMARVASLSALVNLCGEANQVSDDSSQQTYSGQKIGSDDSMVLSGNEQASVQVQFQQQQQQQQPNFCSSLQMDHHQQPWNDLPYSSVFPDSGIEDFQLVSTISEANCWN